MIGFGASGLMERRENIYMFHWLLLKLEVCCEVPFIQFREPSSLPWWFRRLPCVYFHSYPMCWITCILSNSDLNKWLKSGHTKQVNKYATWASLSDRTVILSHHDDFYLLFSIVLDKTQKVDHFLSAFEDCNPRLEYITWFILSLLLNINCGPSPSLEKKPSTVASCWLYHYISKYVPPTVGFIPILLGDLSSEVRLGQERCMLPQGAAWDSSLGTWDDDKEELFQTIQWLFLHQVHSRFLQRNSIMFSLQRYRKSMRLRWTPGGSIGESMWISGYIYIYNGRYGFGLWMYHDVMTPQ